MAVREEPAGDGLYTPCAFCGKEMWVENPPSIHALCPSCFKHNDLAQNRLCEECQQVMEEGETLYTFDDGRKLCASCCSNAHWQLHPPPPITPSESGSGIRLVVRQEPDDADWNNPAPTSKPPPQKESFAITLWWWARWLLVLPGAAVSVVAASAVFGCASYGMALREEAWAGAVFVVEAVRMFVCGAAWVLGAGVVAPSGKKVVAVVFLAVASVLVGFLAGRLWSGVAAPWQFYVSCSLFLIGAGGACGAGCQDEKLLTLEEWRKA